MRVRERGQPSTLRSLQDGAQGREEEWTVLRAGGEVGERKGR